MEVGQGWVGGALVSFHIHAAFSLCASTMSLSSPFTAAQAGARRGFERTELARTGCVRALSDECVQIRDVYLLLRLGLLEDNMKLHIFKMLIKKIKKITMHVH